MSGDSSGDVDIEMAVLDPAAQPTKEKITAGPSYKDRFGMVMTAFDDERTWWDVVKDLLDKDGDFAAKVSHSSAFLHARRICSLAYCGAHHILCLCVHMQVAAKAQAEGVESRQQAIVEVMADLLLEMEGITVHQGLVYVLDELKSYSVSGNGEAAVCVASILQTFCLSFSWSSWLLSC